MPKIKVVKIRNENGTYTQNIPFAVDWSNVESKPDFTDKFATKTLAQYQALTQQEKLNGTIYFITDVNEI